jgi:hypothetical protein
MCALNDPPPLYTKELSALPDTLFRCFLNIWGFGAVLLLVQLPCFRAATPRVDPVCDICLNRSSAIRNNKEFATVTICNLKGPEPRKRPAGNLCRTVVQSEVLAVVAYWMNNSVRVAQKHYLQITDEHHLAGCGIAPESKAVSPAVTAASFIPIHAPSAKTQSQQKTGIPRHRSS